MLWYFYIGLLGSITISIFTLPQLISVVKTKNTAYINILMYSIYLVGCYSFLLGGFLMLFNDGMSLPDRISSGLPLIVAQTVSGAISTTIFVWKLKNYFAARNARETELGYCQKLKLLSDEYKNKVRSLSNKNHNPVGIVEEK